jgi:hypothetical protein
MNTLLGQRADIGRQVIAFQDINLGEMRCQGASRRQAADAGSDHHGSLTQQGIHVAALL